MFIEIREQGKKKKYYLVHPYRIGDKVKRMTRYLGSNLKNKDIERLRARAEKIILEQIKERSPYEFELSKSEIEYYQEVDSKIDISHLQGFDWKRFTRQFTYNTNAIEGSTVEHSKVNGLLDKKDLPADMDEIETVNVAKAVEHIRKTEGRLDLRLIKKLHRLCFEGTKPFAGKLREVEVVIKDGRGNIVHQGAAAKDARKLLNNLVDWYDRHKRVYPPLFLSAIVHNQFENIHPFQDGNGRVGRLLLNYVLLKHHYPPINIRLEDRQKYYEVLQEFEKKGDIKPTMKFLISQYKKQMKI